MVVRGFAALGQGHGHGHPTSPQGSPTVAPLPYSPMHEVTTETSLTSPRLGDLAMSEAFLQEADEAPAASSGGWCDVNTVAFNSVVGVVIVLNAVVLGLETDFGEEHFRVLEHVFCLFFLLEVLLRLGQLGLLYLKELSSVFDCALVVIGTVDLYVLPHLVEAASRGTTGSWTSMLRLFRMLRVLRVLRLFMLFKDLAVILSAFVKAFHIVLWVACLTLIIDYVCAIFLTQTIGHQAARWGEHQDLIEGWFGTIPACMRTLFIIMTLAEWDRIALTLCEQVPALWVFTFFILYILVASYTMVSLITGVISESLIHAQQEDEQTRLQEISRGREDLLQSLRRMINDFDEDQSGSITRVEMANALSNCPNLITRLRALDIHVNKDSFLELIDFLSDKDGHVEIETFVHAMSNLSGQASAFTAFSIQHIVNRTQNEVAELRESVDAMRRQFAEVLAEMRGDRPPAPAPDGPPPGHSPRWNSSRPGSPKQKAGFTPWRPLNAAASVTGPARRASITSVSSMFDASAPPPPSRPAGVRLSARTLS